jgi:hypothetical protein
MLLAGGLVFLWRKSDNPSEPGQSNVDSVLEKSHNAGMETGRALFQAQSFCILNFE